MRNLSSFETQTVSGGFLPGIAFCSSFLNGMQGYPRGDSMSSWAKINGVEVGMIAAIAGGYTLGAGAAIGGGIGGFFAGGLWGGVEAFFGHSIGSIWTPYPGPYKAP